MTSNGFSKPDKKTESTVERASEMKNKSISKRGLMHENVENNEEYLDEIFQNKNL